MATKSNTILRTPKTAAKKRPENDYMSPARNMRSSFGTFNAKPTDSLPTLYRTP